MDYAIEIINLSKYFSQNKKMVRILLNHFQKTEINLAVNNINLQIKEGEIFGLIGPNGAGKSTLIKMLCCLILPTKGTARLVGYDILQHEAMVKNSIGLVSGEERNFYWRLTGRQNLLFFASLYNLSATEAKNKISGLLDFLEVDEPDKRFQEYSTGMKQRLAIARSLLNGPKILFMDEPTRGLDPWAAQNLRKFIKEKLVHQQGKTIFFATHNLDEVECLADRLAIMDTGEIRACGEIQELRKEISRCFFER